jgi:hypothetical protein
MNAINETMVKLNDQKYVLTTIKDNKGFGLHFIPDSKTLDIPKNTQVDTITAALKKAMPALGDSIWYSINNDASGLVFYINGYDYTDTIAKELNKLGAVKLEGNLDEYGEIPLMKTFKMSDEDLTKYATALKGENEFKNIHSSNELSQKLKSVFDKLHLGIVKFTNTDAENAVKWAVSRMKDYRYHNEIERLFTAMESITEAVDTGAYRRLVITSPKHKLIQTGAEKYLTQNAHMYPELTFKVMTSPKPNTFVIDLVGNKATVVGIKLQDLAEKLDKTAIVVVRKEKKLGVK